MAITTPITAHPTLPRANQATRAVIAPPKVNIRLNHRIMSLLARIKRIILQGDR
jgi:hypothetical protein